MLQNKVGLIFGVANKRSIAWACASACAEHGARQAFTYQSERIKENVEELANTLPDSLVVPCDVSDQAQVDATFEAVKNKYGKPLGISYYVGVPCTSSSCYPNPY